MSLFDTIIGGVNTVSDSATKYYNARNARNAGAVDTRAYPTGAGAQASATGGGGVNNTMLYAGAGVAVLLVLLLAIKR